MTAFWRRTGPSYIAEGPSGGPRPMTLPTSLGPMSRETLVKQRHSAPSQGTLTVGRGIEVKGGIQSCERLVVEGRVEASLNARSLEVNEGGVYKGTAGVDNAEISGNFDGELTVQDHLLITDSGQVSGKIRYGRITIATGGAISGNITQLGGALTESGSA